MPNVDFKIDLSYLNLQLSKSQEDWIKTQDNNLISCSINSDFPHVLHTADNPIGNSIIDLLISTGKRLEFYNHRYTEIFRLNRETRIQSQTEISESINILLQKLNLSNFDFIKNQNQKIIKLLRQKGVNHSQEIEKDLQEIKTQLKQVLHFLSG